MIKIDTVMEHVNGLINVLYETVWAGYPIYPKFSIIRLMVILRFMKDGHMEERSI
jgi:hypothetical protein